jgi:ankyrin repeat protein
MESATTTAPITTTTTTPIDDHHHHHHHHHHGLSLHDACRIGDLDKVKKLFLDTITTTTTTTTTTASSAPSPYRRPPINVEETDADDWTPLQYAVRGGNIDISIFLVELCGADLDASIDCDEGREALNEACSAGYLDVIKYVSNVVDFEAQDDGGLAPMHYASLGGHLDVVQYLVEEHHVDISVEDNDRWTPLHFACLKGDLETVQYLVESNDADCEAVEVDGWTPLHCAANKGNRDVVEYLLEDQEVNPDARIKGVEQNALHMAASEGHLDVVKYLIENQQFHMETLTSEHETSLHLAAIYGQLHIVKYLVEESSSCRGNSMDRATRCDERSKILFAVNCRNETPCQAAQACLLKVDDNEYDQLPCIDYLKSYMTPLAVTATVPSSSPAASQGEPSVKLNPELTDDQLDLTREFLGMVEETVAHSVAHHILGYLCLSDIRK